MIGVPTVKRVAGGLASLAREHGAPNAFAPMEISQTSGVSPMHVGRALTSHQIELNRHLAERGYKLVSYKLMAGIKVAAIEAIGPA